MSTRNNIIDGILYQLENEQESIMKEAIEEHFSEIDDHYDYEDTSQKFDLILNQLLIDIRKLKE